MTEQQNMNVTCACIVRIVATGVAAVWIAGCAVSPSSAEKDARARVAEIGGALRPGGGLPTLPPLRSDSPAAEYARFAVLNHPEVQAAYQQWRSTVSAIPAVRALPDPQLTFEADITDTLMTFMPGFMVDVMAPAKRVAMAAEMTASSQIAYREYALAVLRAAAAARKAWVELAYVDEALRLSESSIAALEASLEIANTDYTTGRGMGTLANQVRVTNEIAKVRTDIDVLRERRSAGRTRLKSALGLAPGDPDPAWPQGILSATPLPEADELWRRVTAANPELGRMRAMVDMAIAGVDVARQARKPDFAVGAMADFKTDPLMLRPTASVTLPVWREKIRANITAAEARRDAAVARVSAEELTLAAEMAQMLYMVRDADRMIDYIERTALPNFERAIDTIAAGYQSGMTSPGMIPETQLMAFAMRIERVAALRERETAVTELMLLTASIAPAGAPLLASH